MATARVLTFDRDDQPIECRALIDTCSTANLITEELASRLRLPRQRATTTVGGVDGLHTIAKALINARVQSRVNSYSRRLTFLEIPRIADYIPEAHIDRKDLRIPANLPLADPKFHQPSRVDLLLGSGPALACLSIGQINLSPPDGPALIVQKTQFGWIIGGSVRTKGQRTHHNTFATTLAFDLQRFWEIEEGPEEQRPTPEERTCEERFTETATRNEQGRFIVALPFNERKGDLGESKARAAKRFEALERKFTRDPDFEAQYTAVVEDYLTQDHLKIAKNTTANGFYLPHHAVFKESSVTTKLRVVFDGSSKSSTGISLNDTLMVGPTIQDDLSTLLLRFRLHTYVVTGDIEKMYRQFLVRPEDRTYQRILWRRNGRLDSYELNTVTFGMSCAPYLAIRCLQQLATDESADNPAGAHAIKRDMYVDDLLTGARTRSETLRIRDEVIRILGRGGLRIRQWASNDHHLLQGLSTDEIHQNLVLGDNTSVKTLGLSWNSYSDSIEYSVVTPLNRRITKRTILSDIARIFDPLGLLGPVVVTAKITMQQLWQLRVDWDESLPADLHTKWSNFVRQLEDAGRICFNRQLVPRQTRHIEMHGFCDASERAYGACIYVRTIDDKGKIRSGLLCSKSRVAPLKTTTLARLKLCGAVLLTELCKSAKRAVPFEIAEPTFWTDSSIVLSWLQKPPNTLKTFVANRVAAIQEATTVSTWRHVRSADNPADALSRGQYPDEFRENRMWASGPSWLRRDRATWPSSAFRPTDQVPETRTATCLAQVTVNDAIFTRYSNMRRLRRDVAYCFRFLLRNRRGGELTAEELQQAEESVIRCIQQISFGREIHRLQKQKPLDPGSRLLPLAPFLDSAGLVRVGGRLVHAEAAYDVKHPRLLPKHHVTRLIIDETHRDLHHAGANTTLYSIRQRYWPLDGRNICRHMVRRCIRCARAKPPSVEYIMGNLPRVRTTAARPFLRTGVDYCGPFFIKEKRHRNRGRLKAYVAVFVCLTTKAVHLEVVSDLTTEGFIAALRRFVARRGRCEQIFSDNGSNFIGARNHLQEIDETLADERLQRYAASRGITWHFTPPLSPHFGGIWEAAVKCYKHHMKRVIGDTLFTHEDLNTFVIEVEAILNSRPLTPLSADPNDLLALTPAHFLIGDTLTSLPQVDYSRVPSNRLSHWEHVQKVKRDFWNRWHKEYLNQLNVRSRWTRGTHAIQEGTVVVLKEPNAPPLQWALGRVEKTHPGSDGIIRTVTVRTSRGTFQRNVRMLAPLPTAAEESEDIRDKPDIAPGEQ